jgi:hypothetical protein
MKPVSFMGFRSPHLARYASPISLPGTATGMSPGKCVTDQMPAAFDTAIGSDHWNAP